MHMEHNTRLELRLSDEVKQMLFDLAADAGVSAGEWLRQVIVDAWNWKQIDNAANDTGIANAKPASDD